MRHVAILILIFYVGCNARPGKEILTIDSTRYAVLRIDSIHPRKHYFPHDSVPAEITNADITFIESQIKDQAAKHDRIDSSKYRLFPIKEPEKYFKQIVPFINAKGEREVWVNCMCPDYFKAYPNGYGLPNRQKRILGGEDGGSCFFRIIINLSTSTVINFNVNSAE